MLKPRYASTNNVNGQQLPNPYKTKGFCWAKRKRTPHPNTVNRESSKSLVKQAKGAEGPRFGINVAAAPPSRAHVDLQGNLTTPIENERSHLGQYAWPRVWQ